MTKSWDDFNAKTKWPDGSKRTVQSWCKSCQRAHDKKPATKKRKAERQRERRDGPDREMVYASDRIYRNSKRREEGIPRKGPYKTMHGKPVVGLHVDGLERDGQKFKDSVDASEFRKWLKSQVRLGTPLKRMADAADVDVELLRSIVNCKRDRVTLTYVDRVATANGATLSLIYPEQE